MQPAVSSQTGARAQTRTEKPHEDGQRREGGGLGPGWRGRTTLPGPLEGARPCDAFVVDSASRTEEVEIRAIFRPH